MNPSQRHQAIVNYLDAVGACSYQELATRFGVSEMTVRRDVDRLVQRGGLIKARQVFGAELPALLDELNAALT